MIVTTVQECVLVYLMLQFGIDSFYSSRLYHGREVQVMSKEEALHCDLLDCVVATTSYSAPLSALSFYLSSPLENTGSLYRKLIKAEAVPTGEYSKIIRENFEFICVRS